MFETTTQRLAQNVTVANSVPRHQQQRMSNLEFKLILAILAVAIVFGIITTIVKH